MPCPGPFNFAAHEQRRRRPRPRARLLVFVNNDVEAFRPTGSALMAREALRPEVGAVGAKLLDGEGRIQHGGIVLGTGGLVTHGHRHFPGDAPGYLAALRATHAVSAVTAACLVVEAEKFRAVGGFDDGGLRRRFQRRRSLPAPERGRLPHAAGARGGPASPRGGEPPLDRRRPAPGTRARSRR